MLGKTIFEYSSLGAVLADNVKKKTNTDKVNIKKKKKLIYNSQYSFTKFKDIYEFKELSLDSMYKKLNNFLKKLISLKLLIHNQMKIKSFNDLYYIYKDKYNEEEDGLNTKDKKLLYYKKLRLTDDYQHESEEEEKEQRISKKPDEKEAPKNPAKDDVSKFNEWVNKKETGINYELFKKYFKFQRPSDMLKDLYITNDKYKNNKLVNIIKSGLSDLKNEIEDMSEEE